MKSRAGQYRAGQGMVKTYTRHEIIRRKILFYLRFPCGRGASQMIEWLSSCKDMFTEEDYYAGRPRPFDEVLKELREEGVIRFTNGVYWRTDLVPDVPQLVDSDIMQADLGPLFGGRQ